MNERRNPAAQWGVTHSRSRGVWLPLAVALVVLVALPHSAGAVTARQQSERLLLLNALLFDLKLNGVDPGERSALGVDFIYQPEINDRVGSKDEDIDRPFAVPRPRARTWLGRQMVGAGYVPPVEVNGYTADVASLEYGIRLSVQDGPWAPPLLRPFRLILRTAVTRGRIEGPIASDTLDDRVELALTTYDATLAYAVRREFALYGGMGTGRLDTSIAIREDGTVIELVNQRFDYAFAGFTVRHQAMLYSFQQDAHAVLRNFTFSAAWSF